MAYIDKMLTPSQLALCQADAIARLARLRVCASPSVTELGHLSLQLNGPIQQAREWVNHTIGAFGPNLVRVLRWEQRHQAALSG